MTKGQSGCVAMEVQKRGFFREVRCRIAMEQEVNQKPTSAAPQTNRMQSEEGMR